MTLGERMVQSEAEAQRKEQENALRQSEAKARAEAGSRQRFTSFLEKAVARLNQDVEDGRTPVEIKFPGLGLFIGSNFVNPDDEKHPLHDMWLDFVAKMGTEEVLPCLEYQHDGMGMAFWYVLKFSPALKAAPTP